MIIEKEISAPKPKLNQDQAKIDEMKKMTERNRQSD
jgi:hypothetical protein